MNPREAHHMSMHLCPKRTAPDAGHRQPPSFQAPGAVEIEAKRAGLGQRQW